MPTRPKALAPKRGEIYLVNFDPTIGSEIKKTRPALILQNDMGNKHSPVTIVAAMTSQVGEKLYPTEVRIAAGEGNLGREGVVLLNQIRSIDKQRLVKRLGTLSPQTMGKVDQALQVSLGLIEF
ncbi:MAG: type II toxin-antitoxin system PemK/MazF family toxin [Candidatus Sumerlaeaceae bacterium]